MANDLDAGGISWKYYVTRLLNAGIWSPYEAISYVRYGNDWNTDIIAPQNQVLKDPKKGQLADVSWVTPTHEDSDHPGAHSDRGPSWVTSVVNAIGQSPYWSSSAIIVVWDDWGGWYDDAAPKQLDFRGLGQRVPCLIISPYAKGQRLRRSHAVRVRQHPVVHRGSLQSAEYRAGLRRLYRRARHQHLRRLRLLPVTPQVPAL